MFQMLQHEYTILYVSKPSHSNSYHNILQFSTLSMHLTQWLIVVSLFWFVVEGSAHQRFENDRRSIGDRVRASRHRLMKRGSHIVGNSASMNPCVNESLPAKEDRSMECAQYEWITMNGREGALKDAHMRYFNRFGSKGKVEKLGLRQLSKPRQDSVKNTAA